MPVRDLRSLRGRLASGCRAAFGAGVGYEPQPRGTQFSAVGPIRGYYVDLRAKTLAPPSAHVSGRGVKHGVSPTNLAQYALGWFERSLAGEADARDAFLRAAGALLDAGVVRDDQLLWRYDVAVPKYGRNGGWYSAMAQGQAASVFIRAVSATGDEKWATATRRAVQPLLAGDHGLVRDTTSGPILEECPSNPTSAILNGWVYALWGLRDVAVALADEQSRALFAASAQCLSQTLSAFDTGWWSRYSLCPRVNDVATPFYHRIHVVQLRVMADLTADDTFGQTADRWAAYDTARNRVRAVSIKARGVLQDLAVAA